MLAQKVNGLGSRELKVGYVPKSRFCRQGSVIRSQGIEVLPLYLKRDGR